MRNFYYKMFSILKVLRGHDLFPLIKHSILYGTGNICQRFLSLLLLPIYTRYLPPEAFGIVALLSIAGMILGAITLCGLTNGIGRYFYYSSKEGMTGSEVIWSPLFFVLAWSILILFPLWFISSSISRLVFGTSEYSYLIELTLLGVLLNNLGAIGRGILIFQERVMAVNFLNIGGVLVAVASGLVLVAFFHRGVTGAVEAAVLSSAIMLIPLLIISVFRFKLSFSLDALQKELKFSLPLVGAVVAFWLIDFSDRYILKLFLPLSEVGLYNIGYNVGLLMMLVVSGFSSAWPPYYHKHNQHGEGQSICNNVLMIYLLGSCTCVVILSLASPLLLRLLTTQKFYCAFTVVPFVAMAYMLKGLYIVFIIGVTIKNKTTWQLYLELCAALLNVIGNFLLIPIIGREAAALTTLVSYSVMVIGAYCMVTKINPILNLSKGYILGMCLLTLAVSPNILWVESTGLLGYIFCSILLILMFLFSIVAFYKKNFLATRYNDS